ncbi:archaea-specific SMC-related protein [Haloarcula marina]|uniref:archaea-specific SMC-related protein n=1 Tax=Haloarcula marina TaxID=2961574 RepID=UPI0020B7072C|nr:archaea-specific SMC-related protein [Halomicroarcula marina]
MVPDASDSLTIAVENIGGIRSLQVTLDPGVSILTGRNATNRTSLLRATGAALGGSSGELKADADEGSVALSFDGTEYTRTYERDDQSIRVGGTPYTDDGILVDQYACLLADNPARVAVERGDRAALREFVMAPVDTAEVKATIERIQRDIEALRSDLEEAREQANRRPDLEKRLGARREELAEVRSALHSVRETVAEYEADADTAEAAEAVVEDLRSVREEYERVRQQLETQRSALESLETQRASVADDLANLTEPDADRDQLEDEISRLQRRERDIANTINNLLSVVEFNEGLTDEGVLPTADSDDDVSAALDPQRQTVECWTCGTRVERQQLDAQLDSLREVIDEKRRERNELNDEIRERRSALDKIRAATDQRQSLSDQLADIDAEITERESRIEALEERATEQRDRIEELETDAAASNDIRDSDLLEQYQRLSELEYERGQLEEQVESLEAELQSAREAAERTAELEARIEERRADRTDARNRIADLERRAVETFNEHMATVLDLLGYENVERIWIERRVEGTEDVDESAFALHVVRSTTDGTVYEDTVDHLSESEREVIGFVVALAGYLVHDVHETVPVMLLDSLEAIDADRIAALVSYFAEFVPYLVVALLPEDAAALPSRYDRIQMGEAPA